MIIVTSLAPSHKNENAQKEAVKSWVKTGFKIISVNHISEIEQLDYPDVEFVEPVKTGMAYLGKHYVPVSELINVVKEYGRGLIINSDIIINSLPSLGEEALIFNRYDFDKDIRINTMFRSGFDAFYLTEKHCNLPESKLCLGKCHWDYWLPLTLLQTGTRVHRPVEAHMFHKQHGLQYDMHSWEQTARIFAEETGIKGTVQQVSHKAFQVITSRIENI